MFTKFYIIASARNLLLLTLLCCAGLFVLAQSNTVSQPGNKAPGEWKTFVVKDAKELKIPAPPGKEQTQNELRELKEKMSERNSQWASKMEWLRI